MRQLITLLGLILLFACGSDRGTLQPGGETLPETGIPETQLDASMQGKWESTRHWNKERTDGPFSWSKVSVNGNMLELRTGEESKDSGEWLVAGRYGVVSGKGSLDDPFVLHMLVEKANGGDLHPAPINKGATVEFKVYLKGEVFHVDFPKASMAVKRKTNIKNDRAKETPSAHSCTTDDDCISSCTYGAVNKIWYSKTVDPKKECKDGCAAKGSEAKCESGSCVAYLRGERSEHCTGRKVD